MGIDSPQHALGINDEEATQGDAVFLNQNTIIPRNLHRLISKQWEREVWAQAALATILLGPGEVGELRVAGDTQDDSVEFAELWGSIRKCYELGGALAEQRPNQTLLAKKNCGGSAECH
jgi:hypothetical protein